MARSPSRLTIMGRFIQRKLIEITTDEGWVLKGIINTITQEDGSGFSWVLSIVATESITPHTVQMHMRFNRDTHECVKAVLV